MPARVLAPDAEVAGQTLALPADEAAHVARVLRLRAGAALRVFDGRGREWDARIVTVAGAGVAVTLGDPVVAAPEPPVRYTLVVSVLKGDATDEVIRDAVMMGATRIRPIVATRSEVTLTTLERAQRHRRWLRVAVASAKQCGRAIVPAIDTPVTAADAIAGPADDRRLLLVEPGIAGGAVTLAAVPRPDAVTLAIGPEGGWTPGEVDKARAHAWTPVRLGARTLRASSMALVALAACQAVWDDTA